MKEGKERRSYYRINDAVGLRYFKLNPGQDIYDRGGQLDEGAATVLRTIDKEFNQLVNVLWQESPTTANALGLLNRKLALVAEQALGHVGDSDTSDFTDTQVNISGSGIAFPSQQRIEPGVRLALTLQLRPSNTELLISGIVNSCDLINEDSDVQEPYWLRVGFEPDNETAQERLIQHIVQRQCAMLEKDAYGDSGGTFTGF